MARDELVAAPPDDGGHQGVFSLPTDELQEPDGCARHPPMDADPAEPGGKGSAVGMIVWALVFAIVTLFFVWAYAC